MLGQSNVIKYVLPRNWVKYDSAAIFDDLIRAKSDIIALTSTPYQRNWVEGLQAMQLKREVAGTSRIEGADFTEGELDAALCPTASAGDLKTRSQRQAHAAMRTYTWISGLENDRPVDESLIKEIHRRIVTDCDDDNCPPGILRPFDCNVTVGIPRHRGCDGGPSCEEALRGLVYALNHEFRGHDPLIRALAMHYHFAAMHPFVDGNGRTARALEALMLQQAGLTDRAFIAMSNYYYDEKDGYLGALSAVRQSDHDLTAFLKFGLHGISLQAGRLYSEIKKNLEVALFRNMMYDLFNRLDSPRKRVIKNRQIEVLKILLDVNEMDWHVLRQRMQPHYIGVKNFARAIVRDMNALLGLGAIAFRKPSEGRVVFFARLRWPQEITETSFFEKIKSLPKGKTTSFLG